jgi:hypothetical protein
MWTTKRQELTLDKKLYRKSDVIKGRIDFECVEEKVTDLEDIEKWDRNPATYKVYGFSKRLLSRQPRAT